MLDMDKRQIFDDGVVDIFTVEDIAEEGDMPKLRPELQYRAHFRELSLTYKRRESAKAVNVEADRLIRIPRVPKVEPDWRVRVVDRESPEGKFYRISDVQLIMQTTPKSITLTLEKVGDRYDL
jgi:hypothetical protein